MIKSFTFAIFLLGILIAQTVGATPPPGKSYLTKLSEISKSNQPKSTDLTADNDPTILPGFDKTQTSQLGPKGQKCWQNEKYHVCLTKHQDGIKLHWKNKKFNSIVEIETTNNGEDIFQNWNYKNSQVQLLLGQDGYSKQNWKFGPSKKLEVIRYTDGTSEAEWFKSEYPQDVEEFKKFINSWCQNNDFFVGKDNCVIYDKVKNSNVSAWTLHRFNKSQANQLKTGRKCWSDAKYYHVCLTKNVYGTKLFWKNERSNVKVEINAFIDGNIVQDWSYHHNHLTINQQDDGAMAQQWVLGSSKLEKNKSSESETTDSKWTGDENPEALKQFKQFIDAWCQENDYFVGQDNCAIYDGVKEDSNPAWFLVGFDKNQVNQLKTGRKCWAGPKYHVCLTKNAYGTKLYWKNERSKAKVEINVSTDGSIIQNWTLHDNHVVINQQNNGSKVQQWLLGSSKLEKNKSSENETTDSKWTGEQNPEALKKFQDFIDAWCQNNDFFIKKDDCMVYKEI